MCQLNFIKVMVLCFKVEDFCDDLEEGGHKGGYGGDKCWWMEAWFRVVSTQDSAQCVEELRSWNLTTVVNQCHLNKYSKKGNKLNKR